MSKTRRRESSEVEHLRGKVRELEKENRHLKKHVKKLDRQSHFYDDLVDSLAEEIESPSKSEKCTSCKTGTLKILDLKHVKYEVCDKCEHRKKI